MTIGEDYPPLNNKLIAFYLFPVITRITTGEKSYQKTIYYNRKKSKVEINFSSSDGVATNSSKSLFLCLEATTKVFEEVKYIKHSQNL